MLVNTLVRKDALMFVNAMVKQTILDAAQISNRTKILQGSPVKIKFIYSEKTTKFCEFSTVGLSYVVLVKSTVDISQNFVAFSECMNLTGVILARYSSLS